MGALQFRHQPPVAAQAMHGSHRGVRSRQRNLGDVEQRQYVRSALIRADRVVQVFRGRLQAPGDVNSERVTQGPRPVVKIIGRVLKRSRLAKQLTPAVRLNHPAASQHHTQRQPT
jgi:hypothetical protein